MYYTKVLVHAKSVAVEWLAIYVDPILVKTHRPKAKSF